MQVDNIIGPSIVCSNMSWCLSLFIICFHLSFKWIIVRTVHLRYLFIFSSILAGWSLQDSHTTRYIPTTNLESRVTELYETIICLILFISQLLVDAFRKTPKASWNAKERFLLQFTHSFNFHDHHIFSATWKNLMSAVKFTICSNCSFT
jgi:hypothetical protein